MTEFFSGLKIGGGERIAVRFQKQGQPILGGRLKLKKKKKGVGPGRSARNASTVEISLKKNLPIRVLWKAIG